ncbi:MAG: hypothetical protein EA360_08085 [Balneolaceae bacterium]|nr:MAG: hypothetical protein EA360_08085 [Balneolaceae bacterium]
MRRFIRFHGMKHPKQMGEREIIDLKILHPESATGTIFQLNIFNGQFMWQLKKLELPKKNITPYLSPLFCHPCISQRL